MVGIAIVACLIALLVAAVMLGNRVSLPGGLDVHGPAPITSREAQFAAKWSRHHDFDGSAHHLFLHADRTACAVEDHGSGGRKSRSTYASWEIPKDFDQRHVMRDLCVGPSNMLTIPRDRYGPDERTIFNGNYPGLAVLPSSEGVLVKRRAASPGSPPRVGDPRRILVASRRSARECAPLQAGLPRPGRMRA